MSPRAVACFSCVLNSAALTAPNSAGGIATKVLQIATDEPSAVGAPILSCYLTFAGHGSSRLCTVALFRCAPGSVALPLVCSR